MLGGGIGCAIMKIVKNIFKTFIPTTMIKKQEVRLIKPMSDILKCKSKTKGRGGLTRKQVKFVEGKVLGKTNSDAYESAYVNNSTTRVASANAAQLMRKPEVKKAIERALENAGVTEDYIVIEAKKLYEGSEKDRDKLMSLKLLAELKKLIGAGANVEKAGPKTVNILNVQLDEMENSELVELLMKGGKKD